MTTLVLGLILFVGVHLLPSAAPRVRNNLAQKLGAGGWKVLFSIVSAAGLYFIATGYGAARMSPTFIWYPPAFLSHVTALLMLIAFVFLAATYVPNNAIKARVGHPMLIGIKTWAIAHLLVNGTLADFVLFGTILAWAVFAFIRNRKADRAAGLAKSANSSTIATAVTLVIGILFTGVFALWLHPMLIGVAAIIRA